MKEQRVEIFLIPLMKRGNCVKKLSFIVILLFLLNYRVYADHGILGGKGNTIYPMMDTSVEMMSQKVEIKVKSGRSYVRCEFLFKNTGEKEKIKVGFPAYGTDRIDKERKGFNENTKIYDFETYIDGQEIPVHIKKSLKEEGNNVKDLYYPNWYVWEMAFDEGKVHRVVNTYWVYNSYDSMGGEVIEYVLRSGSTWKNKIHYGSVSVEFDKGFDPQNFDIINYHVYKKNKNLKVKVLPQDKKIVWELYDLEPDFDIGIYHVNATHNKKDDLLGSTLDTSDKKKWEIQNLAKKAYDTYAQKNYEQSLNLMDEIYEYKKSEDLEVSNYALEIANVLDYYKADIFVQKGRYKDAIEYYKLSGILEDKNLYPIAKLYKESGNIDAYMQILERIMRGELENNVITLWAEQEISNLPIFIKERYGVVEKNIKTDKVEEIETGKRREKTFSYKGFILFNAGILILIFVGYLNIKKNR